ncbi:hypothetical protein GCM10017788_75310 [Amycolatopsis acidiphila]|nr:hypothetical protein GCM10017788_75310 [Amycolatopsis acidiphila]
MEALRSGLPIIVSTPSPLAYTVVGRHGAAVNIAKKRPGNQPVGVSESDLDIPPHRGYRSSAESSPRSSIST